MNSMLALQLKGLAAELEEARFNLGAARQSERLEKRWAAQHLIDHGNTDWGDSWDVAQSNVRRAVNRVRSIERAIVRAVQSAYQDRLLEGGSNG